jgi:uncharacterized membrane protein YdbT with pleckstrin-like domain
MSYVKHILQPGENVLVIGRLHWILYWPAIIWLLCCGGAVAAAIHFRATNYRWLISVMLAGLFLLLAVFALVNAWWRIFTTEIAVTTHRVIYKTGFITRHTTEMNIDKIESVVVDQSILGRLFDYGTLDIRGTGASIEQLTRIAHAIQLRNAITSR